MTLYKATRPDGTDFKTGTIDYGAALETGDVVRHPSPAEDIGHPYTWASRYLSVATVATDCIGFRWPCRLFEVEAVGEAYRDDFYSNKRRVAALRVTKELPAHEVFGPQGAEVVEIIARVKRLTEDEARRLYEAWCACDGDAWLAARTAATTSARTAAWDAAWSAVYPVWGTPWDTASHAALATLTKDLISEEHYNILMKPWKEVIG